MKLRVDTFEKALNQLERSLKFLASPLAKDPDVAEQFRAATIQAFEYSYELAFKMIRRQLAQSVPTPQELNTQSFMDIIRLAADAGLIRDVKPFSRYRDARNRTSHAYDESTAKDVVSFVPEFLLDAQFLLGQLKARNS